MSIYMLLNCSDSEETKILRAVPKIVFLIVFFFFYFFVFFFLFLLVFLILMSDLNSFYVAGKYLTKEWCLHHTMLELPVKLRTLIRKYSP